ncbi:inner membrane protein PLUS sensory box protein LssE [Legionella busanensis]|uniref:Inner membrane protein PLUS sensory box protein LssE n=1 Tax=Legionella busanensis TaxID=190655 RepID=A0A378JGL4_9GAMM|nr:EAL domain-containing protein [Legionella busanensis]STX50436.1 inner membrane protein PLUS sensory box protein LssE [Legionella busanensis]
MVTVSGYALQERMRTKHNIDTYYALRWKDSCKVLLKTPNNGGSPSENLAILQHEYELLQKIKSSTVIKPFDFVPNLLEPILVLEGVEGQILSLYLKKHQLTIGDFLNLGLQLVDIIEELHQLNIIHKEIRSPNIIIDPNKLTLKLIDLSASTKLPETFDYLNLGKFDEGLAYISPEQTGRINRPVDYRTDFYSLGVTLFEMLTNQLPFPTDDPLELVHCHIAKKPTDVLELRHDAPEILGSIIAKLLQKMPEERYANIIGLKYDLEECRKQWVAKGSIDKFNLALKDKKDHLVISRNLYGRKEQVCQLLEAFDRISQGRKELVFIAGYSGIGKTSLVKEVHKPIMQHRGYYTQGKFDQLQQSVPYSAIVGAFQNLIKQVLLENETRIQELKEYLIQALGGVGQVVIDVIPEVELIIGRQPPVPKLNPSDAQARFNLVFQNFVRVFAQANHPLVIFLDDLQWADNSSLNFIENLLQDRDTNYLLIIGAYRDNEVYANHPLQLTIHDLKKTKLPFTTITLRPLKLNNIEQLLIDTLFAPTEKIRPLAKSIHDKTHGNPFFINVFIKIIYQKKILAFSYDRGTWEWDLDKIQQQSATDNVIDLLTTKIHLLSKPTQENLKLASCLGHQFNFKTLLIVTSQTIQETAERICDAIRENLIYPLEEPYKTVGLIGLQGIITTDSNISSLRYRFAHDRVQQASYELIDQKDRATIHLKIGRLLLNKQALDQQSENLFEIMNHFNQSLNLITDQQEKLLLAKYNLWAGQKAKFAAAYYRADEYLSAGISLINENSWQDNYDLTFQLYKEFAVCKYLISDFTAADEIFSVILNHISNPLNILEINRLKIEMFSTLGKHTESLDVGINILRKFGIKIPINPNKLQVLSAILKIKMQLRRTRIEDIELQPMTDLMQKAIADLITQLFNSSFIVNQQLFVILICKSIGLSLRYGYTESSSMAMPVYAFVIMHSLNLYGEALSFVKLYNNLKLKYGSSDFEGKNQFVLGSFIEPYQIPLSVCNNTVSKAFKLCCEVGDLVYGNYCNLLLVLHALSAGKDLIELKKNLHSFLYFIARVNISDFVTLGQFLEYAIKCLENLENVNHKRLVHFEEVIIQGKSITELSFFYSVLTRLHFLLGNYEAAIKAGLNHERYSDYDKGLISHIDGKFFLALALFYNYPRVSKVVQKTYLKQLKVLGAFIRKYGRWCPNNFKSYALLFDAEMARLQNQNALRFYEQAIEIGLTKGSIVVTAIASEGAGCYCLANKMDRLAKLYLENAHRYLKDWGLLAKVKLLEKTYTNLKLLNQDNSLQKSTLPQINAPNLDMLAILKFTQLISSEIRLDKLLQKFMKIVLENAGAQRSIILVNIHNTWVVEAEGDLEQQTIYLNGLSLEEGKPKYPVSILNYVQRTQKPLILQDATESEISFHDPYIQQEQPRSLLMMPLFYKGQLCRLLYLENKSNTHTFTPSHLDSLHLLSAQAMTSLENAKLYYQATHDPLTGLANRNMLYEIFQQSSKKITRSQEKLALLFLDLDYFKVINDTLGHDNGDKLLMHIAQTFLTTLREGDMAARIGGDEFAIMLANITSEEQITTTVERIFKELVKPIQIGEHLVQITFSMGISVFPDHGDDIEKLLKLADTALYQAKGKGRNQYHYYSTQLFEEYQRSHGLDKDLQRAYDNQEFFLMYQPFYDIKSEEIIGLETLLRWNHPTKGILEAGSFIETLEKSPLIIPVSEWIIKTACKQAKVWQAANILPGPIAINISTIQFLRQSISELVSKVLIETQLDHSFLELEITESVFIEYSNRVFKEIKALQALGINLVMDDFGTGYSGLSYLKNLPIQKIKIDKTFIRNCDTDPLDQTIISGITMMAHNLKLKVIAEGVENETQLKALQLDGVDGIQGYYYSRPLTIEGCETYLTKKAAQVKNYKRSKNKKK